MTGRGVRGEGTWNVLINTFSSSVLGPATQLGRGWGGGGWMCLETYFLALYYFWMDIIFLNNTSFANFM